MILLLTTGYVIDMYAQSQTIEVTGMVRDAEKIPLDVFLLQKHCLLKVQDWALCCHL